MRKRVEDLIVPLIGSIAKHKTLVACSYVFSLLVLVNSLRNRRILFFNHYQHRHVLRIQTNVS